MSGDVRSWLSAIGLEQHAALFEENCIDFGVLQGMTEQDFKEVGVTAFGHRRKLAQAVAGLKPAVPVPMGRPAEAERRHLTVMFCDLVGSTALAAQLDPEEMRELLRSYQDAVAAEVTRFGGHVAQYLGDGVLAYFGWPRAFEDAGERAVRAALAAVEAVGRIPKSGGSLSARAGIATGLVVVGEMAGQESSATGETPNLAARLQALAEPGSVVIDPNTRRLIGNIFEYRDLGTVDLKGFAKPVTASVVLREGARTTRFEATRSATLTPFVGREAEIATLAERWKQARDGEGQVVLLCGEPGMGKSRLVETLLRQIEGATHMRLRYQCSPYYANTALHPFVEQIERVAKLQRDDAPNAKLDKVESTFAATAITAEQLQLLAAMLSIPTADRYPPLEFSPQRQKEKLIEALAAQIVATSSLAPVLLIFEDAHWSDPTSVEALGAIIAALGSAPILALITYRPEFKPTWSGHAHVTTLSVNRLARRQGAAMVEQVTGGKTLPGDVLAQIVAKSDGIPLFVEELIKTVLETGLLVDKGDHYALQGPLTPLAIPATLQDSLMARLDRLAPVKETAQIGAALGREFSRQLIAFVSPLPDDELSDALTQLVHSELIQVYGDPPDTTYLFKHALVQDAAYQTLLKARRQQLHLKIAETLTERFPHTADGEPELVAHHYTEAGMVEPAIAYWAKAGGRAFENSAHLEAVAHLRKALALLGGQPSTADRFEQELTLLNLLATPLMYTQGYSAPEVRDVYERAYHLSEVSGESDHIFQALFGIVSYHMVRGELDRSLHLAEDMLQSAQVKGNADGTLLSHYLLALDTAWCGQFTKTIVHADQVRALFDPERHRQLSLVYGEDFRVGARVYTAQAMVALGYPDRGRRWRQEALREARLINHPFSRGLAKSCSLYALLLSRDIETMRPALADAIAYSTAQSLTFWLITAQLFEPWVFLQDGRFEASILHMREAIAAFVSIGGGIEEPHHCVLAEALAKNGQTSEAIDLLEQSLQGTPQSGERHYEAETNRVRGDVLLFGRNDPDGAERAYQQAIAVAQGQDAKLFELRAATSLAKLWHRNGRRDEAWNLLHPLYGWFTEGFDEVDLRDARATLSALEKELG